MFSSFSTSFHWQGMFIPVAVSIRDNKYMHACMHVYTHTHHNCLWYGLSCIAMIFNIATWKGGYILMKASTFMYCPQSSRQNVLILNNQFTRVHTFCSADITNIDISYIKCLCHFCVPNIDGALFPQGETISNLSMLLLLLNKLHSRDFESTWMIWSRSSRWVCFLDNFFKITWFLRA